jgi:outer membrane receptor protein involved in Fe transport
MMRAIFLSLLCFLTVKQAVHAQVQLKGQVINSFGTPVSYVSIVLKEVLDSTLLKSTQSDSTGFFEYRNLSAAKYILEASAVGYQPYAIIIDVSATMPQMEVSVLLEDAGNILSEVVVRSVPPTFRSANGKIVVKVADHPPFKASANSLEILSKLPGILVNPDGTLLVSGRNAPAVFIDGKPVPMSAEEQDAFLKRLLPEMIESIEVIENPSGRYDGQFKAIIDIKLKQQQQQGIKGGISTALRKNYYYSADNNLNLSYRLKKSMYSLATSYVLGDDYYRYTALQKLASEDDMSTNTLTRTANNNLNMVLSANYWLSQQHTLDIWIRTYRADKNITSDNSLQFRDPAGEILKGRFETRNLSDPQQLSYALNAAYTYQFSPKSNLVLFAATNDVNNQQNEDIQIDDYLKQLPESYWKTKLCNVIRIRNIQLDYHRTSENSTWEAGIKLAQVTTDNDLRYDTLALNGVFEKDPRRTDRFLYNEYITAGYLSYEYRKNDFMVKTDLRLENTRTTANSETENTIRKRNYLNWLPGVSVSYRFSDRNRLYVAFNRRLTRPDFAQLNPFRFYFSPLNYRVGNPELKPSVTTAFNVIWDIGDLHVTMAVGREKDKMIRYPEYNRTSNELLYLGMNIPYNDFGNLQLSYSYSFRSWWKVIQNAGLYYNKERMPYLGNMYEIGVLHYTLNGSQVFTLPKGYTADLSYRYFSKGGNSLYVQDDYGAIDAGIHKTWLNGKLNTRINIFDMFGTYMVTNEFRESQIINNRFTHNVAVRRVVLTLAYQFGKSKHKEPVKRPVEEERRVRF